jgi:hypothetical protein
MTLPVNVRPLANGDGRQTHAELETQTPGLGNKFLDRLQESLNRIEAMPAMYAEVWQTVRAARLRRFRHIIYYVILSDRVVS